MKNCILFALACFLLTVVSCNMEKRHYRNGWYIEKHELSSNSGIPVNSFNAEKPGQNIRSFSKTDDFVAAVIDSANHPSSTGKQPKPIEKIRAKLQDDPKPKRMTHAKACQSIKDKGGVPDPKATTIYTLSLVSAFTLFFGVGLILALILLLVSGFTIQKIKAAGGPYTEENIAIVKSARRICWGVISFGLVAIGLFVLALYSLNTVWSGLE